MKDLRITKIVREIGFDGVWSKLGAGGGVSGGAIIHGLFGTGSSFRGGWALGYHSMGFRHIPDIS